MFCVLLVPYFRLILFVAFFLCDLRPISTPLCPCLSHAYLPNCNKIVIQDCYTCTTFDLPSLNEGQLKDKLNRKRGNSVGTSMRSSRRKRLQGLCAVASLVGEDKQRQVDLVKAMLSHLGGNDDEDKRSASSSCEVSNAVILGLQTSIATLKERNDGRYTTNDRIALQVLLGATVFDMHGASLRSVARLLGCNREKLAHCKQLWEDYIEGERECPWDFGGGSGKTMPQAYVDSIIGWWHELTRESERMDGQMRNPHDKGDERWYKVRYREDRYTDLLAEMLRRETVFDIGPSPRGIDWACYM